jgi:hypothetical protein
MSSGTLTEANAGKTAAPPDAAFRPWHFFLLASLILATVAVTMSRQATAEHLVLMSITIIAAGVAAAGLYRTLAPLTAEHPGRFAEPLTDRRRAALEREKQLVLRSIKELEFDKAMGKVSLKDFDEMAGRLRARALTLMQQIEQGLALPVGIEPKADLARPTQRTCACGTANDVDALFCKRCGAKL